MIKLFSVTPTDLCAERGPTKTSWWLIQPIKKICSSNWIISSGRGENFKKNETTTQIWIFMVRKIPPKESKSSSWVVNTVHVKSQSLKNMKPPPRKVFSLQLLHLLTEAFVFRLQLQLMRLGEGMANDGSEVKGEKNFPDGMIFSCLFGGRVDFYVIPLVYPPPSNGHTWRFLRIPYQKCNNPGGDCYPGWG